MLLGAGGQEAAGRLQEVAVPLLGVAGAGLGLEEVQAAQGVGGGIEAGGGGEQAARVLPHHVVGLGRLERRLQAAQVVWVAREGHYLGQERL